MSKPVAVSGQRITVYLPASAPVRTLYSGDRDNPSKEMVREYTLTINEAAQLLADLQAAVMS